MPRIRRDFRLRQFAMPFRAAHSALSSEQQKKIYTDKRTAVSGETRRLRLDV
jgi:hypothetical protein